MSDIVLPPYALSLGIFIDDLNGGESLDGGAPVLACDPVERIMGRPGFWHGGALSGMLEVAAFAAVQAHVGQTVRPKPVNVAVQFLRGAGLARLHAQGRVVRAGRRLVSVTAEAWQDDRERLVATAQMSILLAPPRA